MSKLKLARAENSKPIMAEYRDDILRPLGGKYFAPYYKRFRDSRMAESVDGKKMYRQRERREIKTNLKNEENHDIL